MPAAMKHLPTCLAVLSLLLPAGAMADTFNGYMNSITRQQIERMHDNARANAPDDTLRITTTRMPPGWFPREDQRVIEERTREESVEEIDRRWRADLEALEQQRGQFAAKAQAERDSVAQRVVAYAQERTASGGLLTVADYDRMLALAMPWGDLMKTVADSAALVHPEAFLMPAGFLALTHCPNEYWQGEPIDARVPEARQRITQCRLQQPVNARPLLLGAIASGDALDRALSCALLYAAWAKPHHFAPGFSLGNFRDPAFDAGVAWPTTLEPVLSQACDTQVPVGFARGFIAPWIDHLEYGGNDVKRLNTTAWWALFSRERWRDVNLDDEKAVNTAYRAGLQDSVSLFFQSPTGR